MKVVWKYDLGGFYDDISLKMPKSAIPLSVQKQAGSPVLWCLCDNTEDYAERQFTFAWTGYQINMDVDYIGTIQREDGLVYHLFEVLE